MSSPLRVVIGEDDVLLREGIVRLLTEAGLDVVAQAGDAPDLLRKGLAHRPAVLIADVNMPPGHGDDGLRAAIEVRRQRPETGVPSTLSSALARVHTDRPEKAARSSRGVG